MEKDDASPRPEVNQDVDDLDQARNSPAYSEEIDKSQETKSRPLRFPLPPRPLSKPVSKEELKRSNVRNTPDDESTTLTVAGSSHDSIQAERGNDAQTVTEYFARPYEHMEQTPQPMLPRVRPTDRATDWVCEVPTCRYHNYGSRQNCHRCKTPRGNTPSIGERGLLPHSPSRTQRSQDSISEQPIVYSYVPTQFYPQGTYYYPYQPGSPVLVYDPSWQSAVPMVLPPIDTDAPPSPSRRRNRNQNSPRSPSFSQSTFAPQILYPVEQPPTDPSQAPPPPPPDDGNP